MGKEIKVPAEVWCRTCGYYRPVAQMSKGKRAEFNDRINYKLPKEVSNANTLQNQ